jgi:hypothetical protein
MCRVLYDGDRLHGSTLLYYPCFLNLENYPSCRCITFIQLDVLCLVDSHWYNMSGRSYLHVGPLFHELEE